MKITQKTKSVWRARPGGTGCLLASVFTTLVLAAFTPTCGRPPPIFQNPIFHVAPTFILEIASSEDREMESLLYHTKFLALPSEPGFIAFSPDLNGVWQVGGWSATPAGNQQIQKLKLQLGAAQKVPPSSPENDATGSSSGSSRFAIQFALEQIGAVGHMTNPLTFTQEPDPNSLLLRLRSDAAEGQDPQVLPPLLSTFFPEGRNPNAPFPSALTIQSHPHGITAASPNGRIRIELAGKEKQVSYLRWIFSGEYLSFPSGVERAYEKRWNGQLETRCGGQLLIRQEVRGHTGALLGIPALVFYKGNLLLYRFMDAGLWKVAIYFFPDELNLQEAPPAPPTAANSSTTMPRKVILKKRPR